MEMTTGHTLTFAGEKQVKAVVQRKNALQHSFTLQPVIDGDGGVMDPMLVVFQQKDEPRKFHQEMAEFTNLFARSTPSGLCDKVITMEWFEKVMIPNSQRGSALLLDSWGGFMESCNSDRVKNHLRIEIVPPKVTGRIQPLDKYFNRPWKVFMRRLSDKVRMNNPAYILAVRQNIARMISLIHYQFCAPRFRPMVKYAWFSSGYLAERPPHFETPAQFCLNFKPREICAGNGCTQMGFIKCAHCENILCFNHCLLAQHRC